MVNGATTASTNIYTYCRYDLATIKKDERVIGIELDALDPDSLLVITLSVVASVNMLNANVTYIASQNPSKLPGTAVETPIGILSGFAQLTKHELLLADVTLRCVHSINRKYYTSSTFIGSCGSPAEHNVGNLSTTRFLAPRMIAINNFLGVCYIADERFISVIDIYTRETENLVEKPMLRPISSITLGLNYDYLYVTTETQIISINIQIHNITMLTKSAKAGYEDGGLRNALFYRPHRLHFLNDKTFLVLDRGNQQIRIVSLQEGTVRTPCLVTKSDSTGCAILSNSSAMFLHGYRSSSVALILGTGRGRIQVFPLTGNVEQQFECFLFCSRIGKKAIFWQLGKLLISTYFVYIDQKFRCNGKYYHFL